MKRDVPALLCLLVAVAAGAPARAQEPGPVPTGSPTNCPDAPACNLHGGGPSWCHWTAGCFPQCGCPDDYCRNPYPRQCWPPYPSFYQCVPAGDCAHPPCVGVGNKDLT